MSGVLSTPKSKLRSMVAASSRFQSHTGSADATEALEHIYTTHYKIEENESDCGPFAVCYYDEQAATYDHISTGPNFVLNAIGQLLLLLRSPITSPDPQKDADDFEDYAETVIQDVANLSAVNENLMINNILIGYPPTRTAFEQADERTFGGHWEIEFVIAWGVTG